MTTPNTTHACKHCGKDFAMTPYKLKKHYYVCDDCVSHNRKVRHAHNVLIAQPRTVPSQKPTAIETEVEVEAAVVERKTAAQPKVKTGSVKYVPQNGEVEELERAISVGLNTLLTGGTGCGKTHLVEHVAEKVQKIVEKAKDHVQDEAEQDYESILEDAREMDDSLQGFANSGEENSADELATLFTSLLVEVNRTKFRTSREGILNTLALSSALTTRKCFQIRQEALGAPYVALLLDTSGSQRYREEAFTQASRIIYGSLQKAKVNVLLVQYSSDAYVISHIPVEKPFQALGSTQTGTAMNLANNWFEEQGASRALMLVLTDGSPDNETTTLREKRRAETLNAYVLGVRIGFTPCALNDYQVASLQNQFHSFVDVPDANDLPQAIEPHLETFLTGV